MERFIETLDRFDDRAAVLDFDLSGGGDLNDRGARSHQGAQPTDTRHLLQRTGQLGSGGRILKNGADDYIVKSNASFALVKTLDKVYELRSFAQTRGATNGSAGL